MTDTIWYIIHAIVAAVAFSVGFRIAAEIREWRDNTRNIEREIPFTLFLEAYGKAPDRWTLLPYYVRYGADDVRFENYADYRKYKKWHEKQKRDAEAERKRSMNERLFREIRSDLMPTPPTTGTNVITPNPNFTPPPTAKPKQTAKDSEDCFIVNGGVGNPIVAVIPKPPTTGSNAIEPKPNITIPELKFNKYDEKIAEIIQELERLKEEKAKQDDGIVRVDGAKLVPQPAELCGDCPWASRNYPDVAICGIDHHAHLRPERCKYRKQAVLKPTQTVREGECKKCRYFQKHENSQFGYCVRNDEIVNEASVKRCFEPKSKAEERPEPLGTVTTH